MLKFTPLINYGLAGALILPSVKQELASVRSLERSLHETEESLAHLEDIEAELRAGDYGAVQRILSSTEAPLGEAQERDTLLDQLRREIGELNRQVEHIDVPTVMPHLDVDPTEGLTPEAVAADPRPTGTTGLTDEGRDELGQIWPPVVGGARDTARTEDDRYAFEPEDFTVDAVRQGRAYYRAQRYEESLRLFRTRAGEPAADYWAGRALERLGRTREALAAYTAVLENSEASAAQADRAKQDREFLQWLIDFDRKLKDLRGPEGAVR